MPILFSNRNFKFFLLIFFIFLSFYKSPYIFLNGRFIAEEGSFWFRNSYILGPLHGLTQVFWGSGYFNIWANLASTFATFVPIEYAPLVTVYFAFSVKLYLFIYIIYSQSNFIVSNFDKFIISTVILLSPPMVAEVWLNTLTSQVYFMIISILIFFQKDIKESFFNKFSPFFLFISGLTSLLPCTLAPFFFYKYINNKTKFNLFNLISILITSSFQCVIFIYSKIQHTSLVGENIRFIFSIDKGINYIYNVVVKSFLGKELSQSLFSNIFNFINFHYLVLLIIFILLLGFVTIYKKFKYDKILMLLISFFILESLFAFYGAKSNQVQGRFALIPGILLIFIAYRLFQITGSLYRAFFLILVSVSLLAGSYEYKTRNLYPHFLLCMDCPNWKNEISKWKDDNNYKLKIWDYPRKVMLLN